jgi:hypothetical protein
MGDDRLMSRDIAAVRGALDDGSLLRVVGTAISRPLGIGIEPFVATAAV